MGRRRKTKPGISVVTLGAIALVLLAVAAVARAIESEPGVALSPVIAAPALLFGIPFYLNKRAADAVYDRLREALDRHSSVLGRRRTQLLTRDAYGAPECDRWRKELERFLDTQVLPDLSIRQRKQAAKIWPKLKNLVELEAQKAEANLDALSIPAQKMSPADFEAHCAQRLRKAGWSAYVTKTSRDQGVDVIAELAGTKAVFQCKLYSQRVGNKAVQQAATGRSHYGAEYAAVVSNATFTQSARELAASNKVLLLHFSELDSLATRLGLTAVA